MKYKERLQQQHDYQSKLHPNKPIFFLLKGVKLWEIDFFLNFGNKTNFKNWTLSPQSKKSIN